MIRSKIYSTDKNCKKGKSISQSKQSKLPGRSTLTTTSAEIQPANQGPQDPFDLEALDVLDDVSMRADAHPPQQKKSGRGRELGTTKQTTLGDDEGAGMEDVQERGAKKKRKGRSAQKRGLDAKNKSEAKRRRRI